MFSPLSPECEVRGTSHFLDMHWRVDVPYDSCGIAHGSCSILELSDVHRTSCFFGHSSLHHTTGGSWNLTSVQALSSACLHADVVFYSNARFLEPPVLRLVLIFASSCRCEVHLTLCLYTYSPLQREVRGTSRLYV